MKGHGLILASLLAAVSLGVPSGSLAAKLQPRWTPLNVEVSVGTDGRVTDVILHDDRLSATVKSMVVEHAKALKFEPVLVNGAAVTALTYVNFDTCAIPSGNGYDMAIHYVDNGPRLERVDELPFNAAIAEFSKDHQSLKVRFTVEHDGHAHLQEVVVADVTPELQNDIHDVMKDWLKSMRFKPEQIGGKPVATDLEWPLELVREPIDTRHPEVDLATDPTCKLARKASDSPHSINSQVKRREETALPDTKVPVK